jgi:hypothetical protein
MSSIDKVRSALSSGADRAKETESKIKSRTLSGDDAKKAGEKTREEAKEKTIDIKDKVDIDSAKESGSKKKRKVDNFIDGMKTIENSISNPLPDGDDAKKAGSKTGDTAKEFEKSIKDSIPNGDDAKKAGAEAGEKVEENPEEYFNTIIDSLPDGDDAKNKGTQTGEAAKEFQNSIIDSIPNGDDAKEAGTDLRLQARETLGIGVEDGEAESTDTSPTTLDEESARLIRGAGEESEESEMPSKLLGGRTSSEFVADVKESQYDQDLVENGDWNKTTITNLESGDRRVNYQLNEDEKNYRVEVDPNNEEGVVNRSVSENGEEVYSDNGRPEVNDFQDGFNATDLENKMNPETQENNPNNSGAYITYADEADEANASETNDQDQAQWRTSDARAERETQAAEKEQQYDQDLVENGDWNKTTITNNNTGDKRVNYTQRDGDDKYQVELDPNKGEHVEERSVNRSGEEVYADNGTAEVHNLEDYGNARDLVDKMKPEEQQEQRETIEPQRQEGPTQTIHEAAAEIKEEKYDQDLLENGDWKKEVGENAEGTRTVSYTQEDGNKEFEVKLMPGDNYNEFRYVKEDGELRYADHGAHTAVNNETGQDLEARMKPDETPATGEIDPNMSPMTTAAAAQAQKQQDAQESLNEYSGLAAGAIADFSGIDANTAPHAVGEIQNQVQQNTIMAEAYESGAVQHIPGSGMPTPQEVSQQQEIYNQAAAKGYRDQNGLPPETQQLQENLLGDNAMAAAQDLRETNPAVAPPAPEQGVGNPQANDALNSTAAPVAAEAEIGDGEALYCPTGNEAPIGAAPTGNEAPIGAAPTGNEAPIGAAPTGNEAPIGAAPTGNEAPIGAAPTGNTAPIDTPQPTKETPPAPQTPEMPYTTTIPGQGENMRGTAYGIMGIEQIGSPQPPAEPYTTTVPGQGENLRGTAYGVMGVDQPGAPEAPVEPYSTTIPGQGENQRDTAYGIMGIS